MQFCVLVSVLFFKYIHKQCSHPLYLVPGVFITPKSSPLYLISPHLTTLCQWLVCFVFSGLWMQVESYSTRLMSGCIHSLWICLYLCFLLAESLGISQRWVISAFSELTWACAHIRACMQNPAHTRGHPEFQEDFRAFYIPQWTPHSPKIFLEFLLKGIFLLIIWKKRRYTETETDTVLCANACNRWDWAWPMLGTTFRSPTWVGGTQVFTLSLSSEVIVSRKLELGSKLAMNLGTLIWYVGVLSCEILTKPVAHPWSIPW